MVGFAICRLAISRQDSRWNDRNNGIFGSNYSHHCGCTLEASQYQILEIDVTNLSAVFYFNCLVYLPIWRIREHRIEMDSFLLDNPLSYTIYNRG